MDLLLQTEVIFPKNSLIVRLNDYERLYNKNVMWNLASDMISALTKSAKQMNRHTGQRLTHFAYITWRLRTSTIELSISMYARCTIRYDIHRWNRLNRWTKAHFMVIYAFSCFGYNELKMMNLKPNTKRLTIVLKIERMATSKRSRNSSWCWFVSGLSVCEIIN